MALNTLIKSDNNVNTLIKSDINEYHNNKPLRDLHIYKLYTETKQYYSYLYKYENVSDYNYKMLIDAGADVNQSDDNRISLLMHALNRVDTTTNNVKMLIDAGVDIHYIDKLGRNALMYAFCKKDVDKILIANGYDTTTNNVKMLIDAGANIHHNVKMLIDAGANIHHIDDNGINVLMYALCYIDTCNFNPDRNDMTEKGKMLMASRYDTTAKNVKMLIDAGANIHHIDKSGKNVLMYAIGFITQNISHNCDCIIDIIKMIIDAGVNIHHIDKDGNNALMYANIKWYRWSTMIISTAIKTLNSMLIELGVDVNQSDRYGISILMHVVQYDAKFKIHDEHNTIHSVVKMLIDAGANIHHVDNNGKNVLMYSLIGGNIDIIKTLIDAGANIHHVDNNGKNVLMYMCNSLHFVNNIDCNIIKMLIDAGININQTDNNGKNALMFVGDSYSYVWNNNLTTIGTITSNVVKLLIDAGININHIDKNGNNVLFYLQHKIHLIDIDIILKAGIDVNIVMDNGKVYSVLYYAVKYGVIELVQYLNSNGLITPNMIEYIDIKGETLMNWAVRCKKLTIVKIIVGCGADIRKRNSKGESPIDIARNRNYNAIVKYLS